MRGLQCSKSLYLSVHQPELEPVVTPSQQALFDQGHQVGFAAQREYPGGVAITAPYYDVPAAVAETEKAIRDGVRTIFEATFSSDGITAKVDILHRESQTSGWQLIEVKSSTSVKPEYLADVAVQAHVLEEAGQSFEQTYVMHINNASTAPGLENLFRQVDVTKDIEQIRSGLPKQISDFQQMLSLPSPPKVEIGPHCSEPYECPFKAHCWKDVPSNNIFEVPAIGRKAWDLYRAGIVEISDPKFIPAKGLQKHRVEAARTGVRWIDSSTIKDALSKWIWPLYFLDFETISFAIPGYPNTRPYQQVPFQFSCLVQTGFETQVREQFYLHEDKSDPRPPLVDALLAAIKGTGSIVAYNMGFESGCLESLAKEYPQYKDDLQEAKARLVDPLPIFRAAVYDREFKGSFSIKNVAPAILGKSRSYEGMAISDGGAAQRAFVEMIECPNHDPRHVELRNAMLDYCRKDTMEMVDLVNWLFQVSSSSEKKRRA